MERFEVPPWAAYHSVIQGGPCGHSSHFLAKPSWCVSPSLGLSTGTQTAAFEWSSIYPGTYLKVLDRIPTLCVQQSGPSQEAGRASAPKGEDCKAIL